MKHNVSTFNNADINNRRRSPFNSITKQKLTTITVSFIYKSFKKDAIKIVQPMRRFNKGYYKTTYIYNQKKATPKSGFFCILFVFYFLNP